MLVLLDCTLLRVLLLGFVLCWSRTSAATSTPSVCIVGAGTIGSSFAAVCLAQGLRVVVSDPWLDDENYTLKERIAAIWPTLKARWNLGRRIPWERLHCEPDLATAVEGVEHVQECVFEEVGLKQNVLRRLDDLVTDPTVVIASSTSYIPLDQLTAKCRNRQTRKRILIAHPSIPHWGSFMELCGRKDAAEAVAKARAWFTSIGFDCITLHKSIFGHVWNSFLTLNLQHGERLVQNGVCSAQDVNTVLRHLGREFYARHLFVCVLTAIGGDRGVEGGLVLRDRVGKGALAIALSSPVRWIPGAGLWGRALSKILKPIILPAPCAAWLEACREYEEKITKEGMIPVQEGMLRSSELMYKKIPLEMGQDPFVI